VGFDPKQLVIRSLSEELSTFDTVLDRTTVVRDKVIEKLETAVTKLETIEMNDSEKSAIHLGVLTTTLRALNDQEAASSRRVNAKLKFQESQRNDNTSEQVIELIRKISADRANGAQSDLPPIDHNATVLNLEQELRSLGDVILETELRSDPDDLS